MNFELHPKLAKKAVITDLPLSKVLLQDESHYPWMLLVPKRLNMCRIMDLGKDDQLQLMKEMDLAQHVLWKSFALTQLNVAAIGNVVPQLHVHVIGRREGDPAWPKTVWDHPEKKPYSPEKKEETLALLRSAFEASKSGLA